MNFNKLPDISLIQNIKQDNCTQSMEELMSRHMDICNKVIRKFHLKNNHINIEEMMMENNFIFNNAVNSFNCDKKVKFTTWLYCVARFHLLNTYKNIDKLVYYENKEIDKLIDNKFHISNNDKFSSILSLIDDSRIRDIIRMRFCESKPWNEISQNTNLTTQRMISLYKKGKNIIFNKIMSENLL